MSVQIVKRKVIADGTISYVIQKRLLFLWLDKQAFPSLDLAKDNVWKYEGVSHTDVVVWGGTREKI